MRLTFENSFGFARILAVVLVTGMTAGCASMPSLDSLNFWGTKTDDTPIDEPADKLYNEGLTLLNQKEFKKAAKKFEEVDRQHPYSEWGRKALLMTAYAYYEAQMHDEVLTAARRYLALHPGTPDAAYAQYLGASALFDEIPNVDTDQRRTENALEALEEVIRKYPDTEYAISARRKIEVARDQLAGKEMIAGRFYLKQRNFTGAINRFKVVVTKYQTTRHVEEALARLVEAYMALGIVNEAQTAAVVLGHNFPSSPWYQDAYKLVSAGGNVPREDRGSWISQAIRSVRGG
ncbi:MAG: outer membrane protein assembly factor BamD [Xanthobacteraceae bacterium]|nr:outer membrane protein assembly factor BamD [Xanthobacteraceae bacterium]QYK44292.1 MAG: outer membrane protein assembly factor BamD [Xanthobacteraceae bacterium]